MVETVEDQRAGGRTVARRKPETQGGILHWKRENGQDLDWFRARIRDARDGRAPRVLDPFAGGGAIPLEAMRLGCEVTAVNINPVAWFILKCTLDYPRKLAGETRQLPAFALRDRDFMAAFLQAKGVKGRALKRELAELGLGNDEETTEPRLLVPRPALEADLAWQVRAWGRGVLAAARRRLARRYPTYAAYRALKPGGRPFEPRPPALLAPDAQGNTDVGPLNAKLDAVYLKDPRYPRWVSTPTVAYLWTRTVRCKGCRATIPLLKTRWLAKKGAKRVRLTMAPNAESTGVVFGVEVDVPRGEGNPARRREHDRRVGAGTMSRSGVQCPLCQAIMTMQDLRLDGRAGRLGEVMTAVVVDGPQGKEYRLPTELELQAARVEQADLDTLYADIPFGLPNEPTPSQEEPGDAGSALRFRQVAHPLHEPPAPGARHVRPGDTPPSRIDGATTSCTAAIARPAATRMRTKPMPMTTPARVLPAESATMLVNALRRHGAELDRGAVVVVNADRDRVRLLPLRQEP